jgi:hypothetical protein
LISLSIKKDKIETVFHSIFLLNGLQGIYHFSISPVNPWLTAEGTKCRAEKLKAHQRRAKPHAKKA